MSCVLLGGMLWLTGCGSSPMIPTRSLSDDSRRAERIVHDRENELAATRAEVAATRIAAAKKEAELSELRALVIQLRQENGEAHQALLEARQVADARQAEVAALKVEREQLLPAKAEQDSDRRQLAALQDTVASINEQLANLKQTVEVAAPRAMTPPAKLNDRMALDGDRKKPAMNREPVADKQAESGGRIVPAVHILTDQDGPAMKMHIMVQPGDTIWSLARRHHTTVSALRATNGILGDALLVGQELILP
jgi:hypothetical protein